MQMPDLLRNVEFQVAVAPAAARTDNTAIVSNIIDKIGFESVTFVIISGTNTDADVTFTPLVEDGDNSSLNDNAAVADAQLHGTEALAAFDFDDDDEIRVIGYHGIKRYVRLTITPENNDSGNIFIAVVAALSGAHQKPVDTQT